MLIAHRDLEAHVRALEQRGFLRRISRPIDKDTELHPLVRLQFRGLPEAERRAFLFENVVDSRGRRYDIPVLVGGLAASEAVYAMGLQCEPDEIVERWDQALSHPIPPERVATGAAKDVIHRGDSLLEHGGLDEFPVPISTPGFDNAPYLNAGCWVTRDPNTGQQNVGMYRGQLKGALKTGLYLSPVNDTARNWETANAAGTPLDAAIVIGGPVVVAYTAAQILPYGVDELAVAGALIGAPLPVVRAETVDLDVPADADIVIEGRIHTDVLEPEGAFGEAHGYCDPRSLSPYFEVTAITHRHRPIWVSIISQVTPSESSKLKQRAYETQALKLLRDHHGFKGVVRVTLHESLLNRQYAVVTMRNPTGFETWNALHALLTTGHAKILVAVDDDVDPTDPASVNWAIVNRCQPHRDMRVIHPRPLPFNPVRLVADGKRYDTVDSALLVDATAKAPFPPVSLPAQEYMEHALELWQELELPALALQAPWYGYSLGMWSPEHRAEAELATRGEHLQTAAKLAGRQVSTPPGSRLMDVRRKAREEGDEATG